MQECILNAIVNTQNFVEKVTGKKATQEEIAKALQRYFVLNEIKDFIIMDREDRA